MQGVFFGVELLIEFIQLLGFLFPLNGYISHVFDAGGEKAHDHGDNQHTQHGDGITGVIQGKAGIGIHKEIVDEKTADERGYHSIHISGGCGGDKHNRQNKDQRGVVFGSGVLKEGRAGQIGQKDQQKGNGNVPGNMGKPLPYSRTPGEEGFDPAGVQRRETVRQRHENNSLNDRRDIINAGNGFIITIIIAKGKKSVKLRIYIEGYRENFVRKSGALLVP